MLKAQGVELIQNINTLIKKYGNTDKVRKIIVNEFTERNMRSSNAISILNERLELSTLDIDSNKDLILLFVFTKGLYNALTYREEGQVETLGEKEEFESITLEDYFTELEIENLSGYKELKKADKKEQYVFHNMIQMASGHWIGKISCKYLSEIDAGNELIYNFKTQRDPIIDIYGMKRIKMDKNKVQTIKERILAGLQFPDEIRINVLHDGEDEIVYNEKTGDLTIISGTKNIFDGYHRKTAAVLAYQENPDLEFNFGLAITNFSEKKAQDFMVQINEQKPIRQEHIKSLDTNMLGNIVVDAIRDIDTSEFATKIKDNDAELKFGGLTKKSILAIAIEECYKDKLENRLQARPIARHIANVMDYIIGLNVEEFIVHPEETQKVSYINNKNIFAGYIALSAKLFETKNWEDKLEQILYSIDFSINNSIWKSNGLDKGLFEVEMKKSTRNNLYDFFKNLN